MIKNKNNHFRVKFRATVLAILATLLLAAPCSAQLEVASGQTLNIGTGWPLVQYPGYVKVYGTVNLHQGALVRDLFVYEGGTVNMHPGATVSYVINAGNTCTVNIFGGQLGFSGYLWLFGGEPKVTVYGTDFALNGEPLDENATQFIPESGIGNILTGVYSNGDLIKLKFYSNVPVYLATLKPAVEIDIKPGNDENPINLKSNGVVPVAVLTTDDFDAGTIVPSSVLFAGAPAAHWAVEDVDDDGDYDVMFHFRTQQLDLDASSTEATLTGQVAIKSTGLKTASRAAGGSPISGTDKVSIKKSKKK